MGSQIISNKIHSDGIFDIYKRRKVVFIPKNPLNLDWIVLSNSSITRHHCACWWHRFPFNSSTIISDIYELFVSYVRLMAASTSNSWSTIVPTCDYTSYDSSFFLIFFFFFFWISIVFASKQISWQRWIVSRVYYCNCRKTSTGGSSILSLAAVVSHFVLFRFVCRFYYFSVTRTMNKCIEKHYCHRQ